MQCAMTCVSAEAALCVESTAWAWNCKQLCILLRCLPQRYVSAHAPKKQSFTGRKAHCDWRRMLQRSRSIAARSGPVLTSRCSCHWCIRGQISIGVRRCHRFLTHQQHCKQVFVGKLAGFSFQAALAALLVLQFFGQTFFFHPSTAADLSSGH